MEPEATAHDLPTGLMDLLPAHLGRQRWYAGSAEPPAGSVVVTDADLLWSDAAGRHRLWWLIVKGEGAPYQLLVGQRPGGEPAEFLHGREASAVGSAGSDYFYDATLDSEFMLALYVLVVGGDDVARRVRPVSAEQSNTSLVYDDRVILKVFRRLLEGANPDIEVTTALAAAGFTHVAAPVATWRRDGADLAFAQDFLAGGSEGWALALTSLRDLYNGDVADPGEAGGDFAAEARRLGRMTADMHLAMGASFGVDTGALSGGGWTALVDDIERRLDAAAADLGTGLEAEAARVVARLRAVTEPGPALRLHGDYHLGQVMRTDSGWYVLDFEGEPARPRAERIRPAAPAKDVTGMLRSLQYAARFALRERAEDEAARLEAAGEAWEAHNRAAFLEGYHSAPDIGDLLPADPEVSAAVQDAYELDKALYELDYERAYRPDWVDIPLRAVARLVGHPTGDVGMPSEGPG